MIIEIPIGKSLYKISCQKGEEEKLLQVAHKLNQRINNLSLQLKNADEKTLLVISSLMIQEELDRKKEKDEESDEEASDKLNDQDMFEAISETMENVTDYINKLAKKIQNY